MAYTQPNLNETLIPSEVGKYPNYKKTASIILGICHISVVIALIVINSVGLAYLDTLGWFVGSTFVWNLAICILYGTTAVMLIVAGRSPKRGVVISSMVLSIITAAFNGITAVYCACLMSVAATQLQPYDYDYRTHLSDDYHHYEEQDEDYYGVRFVQTTVIFCSLNLAASVALLVVSIWSSALGCKVTCCGRGCCDPKINEPVTMVATPGVGPVQASQLMMPQGPLLLQLVSGQGVYPPTLQPDTSPVSDEVPEPPNKV